MMNQPDADSRPSGLPVAIGAYVIWGFLPLYLLLVRAVPAFEFVAWRIIWTLPICLLIVGFRRQGPQLRAALADSKSLRWLFLSATLIAVNWVVYVWAIQNNHVYAASLGYYINPLVNVLLGTLLLLLHLALRLSHLHLPLRLRHLLLRDGLFCFFNFQFRRLLLLRGGLFS